MKKMIQIPESLSFWGTIFLLFILFGLKINYEQLLQFAKNDTTILKLFSIYFLISPFVFIIFVIIEIILAFIDRSIDAKKGDFVSPLLFYFASFLDVCFFVPYEAIIDIKDIFDEFGIFLFHFIELLLWWSIVGFFIYNVLTIPDNIFIISFKSLPTLHIIIALLAFFAGIVIIGLFIRLLWSLFRKRYM